MNRGTSPCKDSQQLWLFQEKRLQEYFAPSVHLHQQGVKSKRRCKVFRKLNLWLILGGNPEEKTVSSAF